MKTLKFDKKLFVILDKYSPTASMPLGKTLEKIISASGNAEMIVPVLGMQGMGKSTLINAILGESILPSTADETTCIPVEVKYGEKEYAEVHFKKSSKTIVIHTTEEMSEYVDNNYNKANEKNVERIVLFRKCDLLRSGMVIVDLPGVGSMTHENADTTNRYIQNLCTAIFVIPTTPTLRKVELIFIKGVWSQFTKAIFVQNEWGESKRELEDSVEFNSLQLKKVADELKTPYDGEITVVNAYNALAGKLSHNDEMVRSSKIDSLVSQLEGFAKNWDSLLETSVIEKAGSYIDSAIAEIDDRIIKIDMDEQALEEALRQEYEEFRRQNRALNTKIDGIKTWLRSQRSECDKQFSELSNKYAGKVSAEMTKVIEGGVTDGQALSKAFKDIQEVQGSDFANECFNIIMTFRNGLQDKMEELGELVSENPDMSFNAQSITRANRFKIEQLFAPLGGIGGGIGGIFAGSAVGGVVTAALTGTAIGAAAGPIGIVAGVIVGALCGVFGALLGNGAKAGVQHIDKSAAKKEVESKIDDIRKAYSSSINKKFIEMISNIEQKLNDIAEGTQKEEKNLLNRSINCEKPEADRSELNKDKATLEEIRICLQK